MRGGRGRRGGRNRNAGPRPVDESTRIDIVKILEEFRASDDQELPFSPDLSNDDRAVVHTECRKMGLLSRSRGKGDQRHITVYKPENKMPKFVDAAYELPLEEESLAVMGDYFRLHPPSEKELESASSGSSAELWEPEDDSEKDKERRKKHKPALTDVGRSSLISPEEAKSTLVKVQEMAPPNLTEQTRSLPVASYRDSILKSIDANQVTIVAGETGCGKTTQVPQYVMDHWLGQGKGAYIICTQPRRISAMSIADRVATERGDTVGNSVGYQIRLEAKCNQDTSMLFCTNGILLRKLTQAEGTTKELDRVTHIIVDEVHERDMFADFLLIVLKELLPSRPDLKVILMSATMNENLFSEYFNNAPILRIPGMVHPVENYHLDEILLMVNWQGYGASSNVAASSYSHYSIPAPNPNHEKSKAMEKAITAAFLEGTESAFSNLLALAAATTEDGVPIVNAKHDETGASALMVAAGKGREDVVEKLLHIGADVSLRSADGSSAANWAERFGHYALSERLKSEESMQSSTIDKTLAAQVLGTYQQSVDPDEVDLDLAVKVMEYIDVNETATTADGGTGAILVFLPGWDEISRLRDTLLQHPRFGNSQIAQVFPLHSMVAPQEQRRVFNRPPPGVRKIVLATNIAETAVTIDDVVYVIDSGRLKEKSFDPYTGVSTLQTTWISKAGAQQRRGRAGRCQPGKVFRLFSKQRLEAMANFQLPELKRSPLEELCLQVKLLEGVPGLMDDEGGVARFLSKAIEPPIESAVESAMQLLHDIGAVVEGEKLTKLGRHLANLPLHPRIGKMILFASLFGTLPPVLTAACAASYRAPFVMPLDSEQRRKADKAKHTLSDEYGGASDHLATTAAFEHWDEAKRRNAEKRFLEDNQISSATMNMIAGMRNQLERALFDRGMIGNSKEASRNAHDGALVRAVLAVGFYPLIGLVKPTKKDTPKPATIATAGGNKVKLAGTSVNVKVQGSTWQKPIPPDAKYRPVPTLIVYDELTRNETQLTIREATAVDPIALMLVSSNLAVEYDEPSDEPTHALLCMDGWLRVRVPVEAVARICVLRLRLASAFAFKVENPGRELPNHLRDTVETAARVLITEGRASAKHPLEDKANQSTSANPHRGKNFKSGGDWRSDEPSWRGKHARAPSGANLPRSQGKNNPDVFDEGKPVDPSGDSWWQDQPNNQRGRKGGPFEAPRGRVNFDKGAGMGRGGRWNQQGRGRVEWRRGGRDNRGRRGGPPTNR